LIKSIILLKQKTFKKDLFNISKKIIYNFLNKKKEAQIENNTIKINKKKDFYNKDIKNKK